VSSMSACFLGLWPQNALLANHRSVSLTVTDPWSGFGRFTGLNGQISEFRLKPNWTLPLQEEPEDWDINPATEDLPLDQILANAAAMRREHLDGACTSCHLHMADLLEIAAQLLLKHSPAEV